MKTITALLLTFSVISLSLLETAAYKYEGYYSIIASRIWIIWTLFFLMYSICIVTKTLLSDIKAKRYLGIFSLVFVTFVSSYNIKTFPLDISSEAILQVTAGLNNLMNLKDYGYTKTAFLGYPNRQYLLVSLPSYLWGKSTINYRLGYLLFFLGGIYLFYSGLVLYYSNYYIISKINLAILSITAIPLVQLVSRSFEQSILPLSLTLQAIGIFLISYKKTNSYNNSSIMDYYNASN